MCLCLKAGKGKGAEENKVFFEMYKSRARDARRDHEKRVSLQKEGRSIEKLNSTASASASALPIGNVGWG